MSITVKCDSQITAIKGGCAFNKSFRPFFRVLFVVYLFDCFVVIVLWGFMCFLFVCITEIFYNIIVIQILLYLRIS